MPSLTLTDPDMILPYDGSERESQTPSPPSQLVYLSNLNARYNSHDPHTSSTSSSRKKNFSRWNHEDLSTSASRRLSDIGEELSPARTAGFDEEEEEQGPSHYSGQSQGQGQGQQYTPTGATESKDNASSSSSTVSAGSTHTSTRDGGSKPEDSVSDQDQAQSSSTEQIAGLPVKNVISSAAKGKGPGDEFSSAILSSEAERILDNAKKRLTVGHTYIPLGRYTSFYY